MRILYIARSFNYAKQDFIFRALKLKERGYRVNVTDMSAQDPGPEGYFSCWVVADEHFPCAIRGLRVDKIVLLSGVSIGLRDLAPLFSEPGCPAIIEAE